MREKSLNKKHDTTPKLERWRESDDVEDLRINMGYFNYAREEVHPAFGVAEEELAQLIQNGMIHFDKDVDATLRHVYFCTTAMAAKTAQASELPSIELVSPDHKVGFSKPQKVAAITKAF
ncbi:transport between ER and Golgi ATPase protein [Ceratobasidium sp. 423]|nr:transport between ER and Golgi ATPase protein [Ceratobasidium sp. 423]